jgi:HAD superfamily phosphatase (TIGR01668 family)
MMLRFVTPHLYLASVLELDAALLRSQGVAGLLLDLDGTLKEYRAQVIPVEVMAWVERLQAAGLRLCLLSNGKTPRIERFAKALGIPFVAQAFKPLTMGCHRALKKLKLPRSKVALVGDQVFADVLAGRLAGLFTILVPPLHPEEPWFTRLKRPLERQILRWLSLWSRLPESERSCSPSCASSPTV